MVYRVITPSQDWIDDCRQWRGVVLTGRYSHWCFEWDDLPIDETCPEWPCECADELIAGDQIVEGWE